jgi:hypothetical protein
MEKILAVSATNANPNSRWLNCHWYARKRALIIDSATQAEWPASSARFNP